MTIQQNAVVSLHYALKEGSAEGELIEETFGGEPLQFIFGVGQMISGFEQNLSGKNAGDSYSFLLSPEEAYGPLDQEAIVEVPIDNFADENGQVNRDFLIVGAPIHMSDEDGHNYRGIIDEVKLQTVLVNFNHPMAGKSLHFSGEIIEVREATESELDHGHVHGPGGHHH
ncbi:MAG: peptidylprolyl isomerase [Saprospiraceae bacterium]|nr:peptidylprolyl isomerase [Saprospiraceae bacterium]